MTESVKLVCLHQAGGDPSLFTPWSRHAPPEVEVVPVTLPTDGSGLGRRRRHRRTEELVPVLAGTLADKVDDGQYVLFGHSMGALLAYLIARRFSEHGGPRPRALVVACYSAPHLPRPGVQRGEVSSAELIGWLHHIGGIPDWLAAEPDLLEPFLGLIRDDLHLCSTYRHVPQEEPLDLPVHVFGATEDKLISAAGIRGWSAIGRDVSTTFLLGDHFLVSDGGEALRKSVFDLTTEEP